MATIAVIAYVDRDGIAGRVPTDGDLPVLASVLDGVGNRLVGSEDYIRSGSLSDLALLKQGIRA